MNNTVNIQRQANRHDIILASASPRRSELLHQLGWQPLVSPVNIDESVQPGEAPAAYCLRMAKEKMLAAQPTIKLALPIVTADTIVVVDDEILGKPTDEEMALLTLNKLSARDHQVYSSVSVHHQGQSLAALSTNTVIMGAIDAAQMRNYVASGEPMDKAGAYGIQGMAAAWIERIEGSYSSIMGLPLYETTQLLQRLKIQMPIDVMPKL